MSDAPRFLAELTTEELDRLLGSWTPCAALVPVGSAEPHGPHLPLGTDSVISEAAAVRASILLGVRGVAALVAPTIGYGVTRCAEGFRGALSLPADVLTALLRSVCEALLADGWTHVCLVNNHLEPEHDVAVRAVAGTLPPGRVSVACPLTRRWARTLSEEFRSGACHAGRYETSLVMAARPELVRAELAAQLPTVGVSLSDALRAGVTTFRAMGLERAYTGAPREATPAEGLELLDRLATMVVAEVEEGLAALRGAGLLSPEPDAGKAGPDAPA